MNADEAVQTILRKIHNFKSTYYKQEFNGANCLLTDAADLIESLREQLAASERRERAAVAMCDSCNFKGTVGCHCAKATWRGPQAGKLVNVTPSCSDCRHEPYCDFDTRVGKGEAK